MADKAVPHFHNDQGIETIRIGAKRFTCIGARPPYDHPHVYLDMGSDTEIVCPYCSTRFVHDASLQDLDSDPAGCLWLQDAAE